MYCLSPCIVVPPVIAQIFDEIVVIGTLESIICDATGSDDSVSLVWSRADGEPLDDSRISQFLLPIPMTLQVQLVINNVGIADEGTYVCTATNPDGEATTVSVSFIVTGTHA